MRPFCASKLAQCVATEKFMLLFSGPSEQLKFLILPSNNQEAKNKAHRAQERSRSCMCKKDTQT